MRGIQEVFRFALENFCFCYKNEVEVDPFLCKILKINVFLKKSSKII